MRGMGVARAGGAGNESEDAAWGQRMGHRGQGMGHETPQGMGTADGIGDSGHYKGWDRAWEHGTGTGERAGDSTEHGDRRVDRDR